MNLCANLNNIYSKLAQLEAQIQTYCIYPHPSADSVQLEAPDYDYEIGGPQVDNKVTTRTRVTVSIQGLSSSSETLFINAKETEDSSISPRDSQDSELQENTDRSDYQSQHS